MAAGTIASALEALKESAGSAVGQVLEATHIDRVWKAVQSRISSHFIEHYEERVKERSVAGSAAPAAAQKKDAAEPGQSA